MNVLALDTCLGACSVAVRWRSARGEWLLREDYRELEKGHAEMLLPMVQGVMEGAGLSFSDLTHLAVTLGPGSFTGVRIGLSAARGLALAAGLPIVGMTSLAVMAHRADLLLLNRRLGVAREGARMLVAVDVRRGQHYVQVFGENVGEPLGDPVLTTTQEAAQFAAGGPVVAVGSGAAAIAAAAGGAVTAVLPALQPHARHLALLSPSLRPLDRVTPIYLRPADAKPQHGQAIARAP